MNRRYQVTQQTQKTGAPDGKFWEKGLKPTAKWIKLFEAILSIFGDCWEKCIRSSLPARLMEEFPASKVHLQPATWLTGKFPSRRMYPSITGQFGCGLRAQLRPSVVRGGGGLGGLWHITHRSYSRHQVHSDTLNYLFPSNTFRPRTYCFLHVSHPAKIASRTNIFEEQIHWISPEGGHGWTSVKEIKTDCNLAFKNLVLKLTVFQSSFYCLWSLI